MVNLFLCNLFTHFYGENLIIWEVIKILFLFSFNIIYVTNSTYRICVCIFTYVCLVLRGTKWDGHAPHP